MSRLTYGGDTTMLFGAGLPTPRIDTIKISSVVEDPFVSLSLGYSTPEGGGDSVIGPYDLFRATGYDSPHQRAEGLDENTDDNFYATSEEVHDNGSKQANYRYVSSWNKLDVEMSFLFNSADTFDPTTLFKELFDYQSTDTFDIAKPPLWINLFFLRDKDKIDKFKADKNYISEIREMILNYAQDKEIFQDEAGGMSLTTGYGNGGVIPALYKVSVQQYALSDFYTDAQITSYDDSEGNTVYKVSGIKMSFFVRAPKFMEDATMFAAVSTGKMESMAAFSKPLLAMNYSDITYEDYVQSNKIAAFGDPVYVDSHDMPCTNTPIRALDGKYYKTESFGYEEMYGQLTSLVSEYIPYQRGDQDLRLCIEGIISTALTYRNDITFLEKLSAFIRFWPGKTSGSEKAYELLMSYEIKVNNFNANLREQDEVFKRIYRNFKVMDLRIKPDVTLTPSGYDTVTGEIDLENTYVDDFIPKMMYHSAMAKFQPISAATNSRMRAEIEVSEEERDDAFDTAIAGLQYEMSQLVLGAFNQFDRYMEDRTDTDGRPGRNEFDLICEDMSEYLYDIQQYFLGADAYRKYYSSTVTKGEINTHTEAAQYGGCGEHCKQRPQNRLTSFYYWMSPHAVDGAPFELVVPRMVQNSEGFGDVGTVTEADYIGTTNAELNEIYGLQASNTAMVALKELYPVGMDYTFEDMGADNRKGRFIKLKRKASNKHAWKDEFQEAISEYLGMTPDLNPEAYQKDTMGRPWSTGPKSAVDPIGTATFNEIVYSQIEQISNTVIGELDGTLRLLAEDVRNTVSEGADDTFDALLESGRESMTERLFEKFYGINHPDSIDGDFMGTALSVASLDRLGGTLHQQISKLRDNNPFNFYIRSNPNKKVMAPNKVSWGPEYVHDVSYGNAYQTMSPPAPGSAQSSVVNAATNSVRTAVWWRALSLVMPNSFDPQKIRDKAGELSDMDKLGSDYASDTDLMARTVKIDSAGRLESASVAMLFPHVKQWNFGNVIAQAVARAFIDIKYEFYDILRRLIDITVEYAGFQIDSGLYAALNNVDILVKKGGYFFYDLEKYIRKKSFMSRFVNVDGLLLSMPGAYEMTNLGVGITNAKIQVAPGLDKYQWFGVEGTGIDTLPDYVDIGLGASHYISNLEDTTGGYESRFRDLKGSPEIDADVSMELSLAGCYPHVPYIFENVSMYSQRKTTVGVPIEYSEVSSIDVDVQYYGFCSPYNGIATFNDLFVSENEKTYLESLGVDAGAGDSSKALTERILAGEAGEEMTAIAVLLGSPMVGLKTAGEYSMLLPRAYSFTQFDSDALPGNQTWRGNYRLAMYQYQYFMDDDDAHAWNYMPADGGQPADDKCIDPLSYTVGIRDHSYYVLMGVYDEYISTYNDFYENYFQKAHEYCAYDDFSGKFNDFFAQAITAAYPENLEAPWYRMVTTYVYFLDIISKAYGGNKAYMLEAAMSLLATIRPETGNLEALDEFELSCRAIKDIYEEVRERATDMYLEETLQTRESVEKHLTLVDVDVTSDIPSITQTSTTSRVWSTTIYDHIGDYSTLSMGGDHGEVLSADAAGDDDV